MKTRKITACGTFVLAMIMNLPIFAMPVVVLADTYGQKSTGKAYKIAAVGQYGNWERVSNVSQFAGKDGNYCFACNDAKSVVIVKTQNGKPLKISK